VKRSRAMYWTAAVLATVAALYSYSGYVMNLSLGVGRGSPAQNRGAMAWLAAACLSTAAAVVLAVLGWRHRRHPDAGAGGAGAAPRTAGHGAGGEEPRQGGGRKP
jgi:hypothetical protein